MSESQMFCLTKDDDGHWYIIPDGKESEWEKYVAAVSLYWWNLPEGEECPEQPEWAINVGGSYSNVKFPSYEIL